MELLEVLKTDDIDLSKLKSKARPIQKNMVDQEQTVSNTEPVRNSNDISGEGKDNTKRKDLYKDVFGEPTQK